jgi:hypothetical protein
MILTIFLVKKETLPEIPNFFRIFMHLYYTAQYWHFLPGYRGYFCTWKQLFYQPSFQFWKKLKLQQTPNFSPL